MLELIVGIVGIVLIALLFALSQAEQKNFLDYLAVRNIRRQADRLLKETKR